MSKARRSHFSLASASAIALASAVAGIPTTAHAQAVAEQSAISPTAQRSEHERLFELFKASDEASLRRNPLQALLRGDQRYAGQLGDLFSDAHFEAERAAYQSDLDALHAIARDPLSDTDKLAYDCFEYTLKDNLAYLSPDLLQMNAALPMNHFFGIQTSYPTLSSGKGAAPYTSVADYENGLRRNHDFVHSLDVAISQWRKGEAEGIVDTRLTVSNMIEQLDTQLAQKPEDSPYYGPVKQFPDTIGASDRVRLAAAYHDAIVNELYPAISRLRDFLRDQYLPHARSGVGLKYMKGGDKLYRYLVQTNTTLPLDPDEVHNLGLSEVARITGEFQKVQQEIGFKGTLQQFFQYMRTDPKFQPTSREGYTQDFYRIKAAVEAKVSQYFSLMPKSALVIRPYEPFREKFEAGGSYDNGTPDGSRPGTFYFNAFDLPSRSTWEETTLFLHEG